MTAIFWSVILVYLFFAVPFHYRQFQAWQTVKKFNEEWEAFNKAKSGFHNPQE